jgi:CDP-diacylglycerol--glycerol-3-phosphate 3-phosphatidyltransferase
LRFALAVPLFVCLVAQWWWWAAGIVLLAAFSDWLDGWLARRTQTVTALGRSLDPLADKVLVCGSLIFLMQPSHSGVADWMVAVVVIRELIVTSLRSVVEQQGLPFGAAFLGKLKMVVQTLALLAVLSFLGVAQQDATFLGDWQGLAQGLRDGLLYAMVALTALSGVQYLWRAYTVVAAGGRA